MLMLEEHPYPEDRTDPFALDVLAEPYEFHACLRELGTVVHLTRHDVLAVARHDDVQAALGDPETFCSSAGVGLADFRREEPWRPPSLLLEADPPAHTKARHVITQVLSLAVVRGLRETFAAQAEGLVEALVERQEFDGVRDLAAAFPLKVFPDAVGLPEQGRENLLPYGSMAFNGFGPRNVLFERAMAGGEPVKEWIARHCEREALKDDGLGARIHEVAAAEGYEAAEASLLVRSFLSAGVDTTVHALGNALYCLASYPDQWEILRGDPDRARHAFEETVRFESPVQTFFRTTTRSTELDGVEVPGGVKVLLFLASANRDPRRWTDADRFDICREARGHVGFGSGIHACVGQMMARLEGEVVLQALARQVERIELAGEPVRQLNNTLRGFESLPVAVVGS
ncbi:MAG: cytochrome P450 [Actinobacteria bacterium]|nr:cytochrome P450 [Actinomycetota bacterium]